MKVILGPKHVIPKWTCPLSPAACGTPVVTEMRGDSRATFDLAIAVHALAFELTLVTADRGFERLWLRRENWLA